MGKGIWEVGWDLNLEQDLHQKIRCGCYRVNWVVLCLSICFPRKITHQHSLMKVCVGRNLMGMDGVEGNIRGMNIS